MKKKADAIAEAPKPRSLPPLWRYWDVELRFFSRVYGSVPADPEVITAWLAARQPTVRPPGGRSIDEVNEEVLASIAADADSEAVKTEYQMLVFQHDPANPIGPLCFRSETLRAHHKDCARVLSAQYMGRIEGERAFSTKVINGLYPDPRRRWIELLREDDTPIVKPDGEVDKFVHTRNGSSLKRLAFVEPPVVVRYRLQTLGNSIKADELGYLTEYGGVHGYGGERSQDGGKYLATFQEVTRG